MFHLSLTLGLAACSGGDGKDEDQNGINKDGGLDASYEVPDSTIGYVDSDLPDVDNMAPPEGCGDGVRGKDSAEECDDGNNVSGDGCQSNCRLEAGYNCDPNGGGCMPVCGDGLVAGGEACDDGTTVAGDGCSQSCAIEPGWGCPNPGQACESFCGDSIEVGSEQCDYGDNDNGDGCSATCTVETGWLCGAGVCTAKECSDGLRVGTEVCDDGNKTPGDGCNADCTAVDPYFTCPDLGGPCVRYTRCGDGTFTADEQCDDGNTASNDGCSATCQSEGGYVCTGGTLCAPVCGDGKVSGGESCDDSNAATPGCSAACQIEPGYKCPSAGGNGGACSTTTCGDKNKEGLEECDDTAAGQQDRPFDGCYQCKLEPSCTTGACTAKCGDGLKFVDEVCDDGNNRSGDGCSADCTTLEPGFACQVVESAPPDCIDLPVIYRDFKSYNVTGGHPDFNDDNKNHSDRGLVRQTLGWDANDDGVADATATPGLPATVVYAPSGSSASTSGPTNFNQWHRDGHALGKTVIDTMRFCNPTPANGNAPYVFDDRTFYPLDARGWAAASEPVATREALLGPDSSLGTACTPSNTDPADPDAQSTVLHNYGFTSEVRFYFTYKGGEALSFRGDDDVWVFIAGQRVIDLGGVHCAQSASIVLNNGNAVDDANNNGVIDTGETTSTTLNLVVDRVYEVVVYQAERHADQSSYRLSLGKFFAKRTDCVAVCGDGIRTTGELCDSGGLCSGGANDGMACSTGAAGACPGGSCVSQNTGGYGLCGPDCKSRGPFCGDGTQQPQELCDLGASANSGAYNGCNPTCTLGPRCGDMKLDLAYSEQCDQGMMNKDATYNACSTQCKLGPRCGDKTLQSENGEQCDDGLNKASYNGCAPSCKIAPTCGDGVVQATQGEQCDKGKDMNTGGYGGCSMDCKRNAFCGDGKLDSADGEECDDGNANSFDGCSPQCRVELILL